MVVLGFGFAQLRSGLYFCPRPPTGSVLAMNGVAVLALTAANHQPSDTDFPGFLVRRACMRPLRSWPRHLRTT